MVKSFPRHIALPPDHGSWVFLLSPLLIGIFTAGAWRPGLIYLILAALAAFLLRQPVAMAVKAYSGRRSRADLPAIRFWILVYGGIALLSFAILLFSGFGYLLFLALPGVLVFAWHLWLVSRRSERHQMGVDIVASGTLALAAPAAYWVALGVYDPLGWGLWALSWLQSAASIVHAFLRLEQRKLKVLPPLAERLRMAGRALAYTSFNLLATLALSLAGVLPFYLPIAYTLQWVETLWGTLNPAIGVKPTRIGIRQLVVSALFTLLFAIAWNLPEAV